MDTLELKQKILVIDGAIELPESFIENICKLAIQQNKVNDAKWMKNSISNALKRFKQQLLQKKEKELRLQNQKSIKVTQEEDKQINLKKESRKLNNCKTQKILSNQEFNESYEIIQQLPRIENLRLVFPNIDGLAIRYIINNHGFWTLKLMSLFKDTSKIFTDWAIHFTYTLRYGFNIKKCIELNFHKDPNFMYETIINSKEYLENSHVRKEYWKWKRKENRENYRRKKNKIQNDTKINSDDICKDKGV
ncbi:hypothetical protein [Fluviispira vulneris]|uniref:hypothetical protein n=1 Tax=Fluviispira vulneris TaxID=2763012 RepID=UPI0016487D41|nr:hypothetical protein [Fluviispira vulneris]